DHSATRCRERRLFTNARIEWIAAIRYAATAANSKDRIGKLGENIVSDLRSSAESAAKTVVGHFHCSTHIADFFCLFGDTMRHQRRGLAFAVTKTSPTQPNPTPVKKEGIDHAC